MTNNVNSTSSLTHNRTQFVVKQSIWPVKTTWSTSQRLGWINLKRTMDFQQTSWGWDLPACIRSQQLNRPPATGSRRWRWVNRRHFSTHWQIILHSF